MKTQFIGWYAYILLVFLILIVSSVFIPQVIGEDPGTSFAVWTEMIMGGDFNKMTLPHPSNIQKDLSLFLTWWTPGQYLFPGAISQLTNTSLGAASLITTVFFSIIGLIGWKKVYEQFSVEPSIIAICLMMLVSSRLFTTNFINYTGGELLIFGGQPWSIYFFLKYRHRYGLLFVSLLLISLVCFVLKSSYTIGLGAIATCAGFFFIEDWYCTKKINSSFYTVLVVGVCAIVYFLLTQVFFLRLGTNPTTGSAIKFVPLPSSFEILGYPLTQWLNLSELYLKLNTFNYSPIGPLYGIVSVLSFGVVLLISIKMPNSILKTVFLGFYIFYCALFLFFYNTGAEISIEYRHLKIMAYLFLPLLLQFLSQKQRWGQIALTLLFIINFANGVFIYGAKKWEIYQNNIVGNSGYTLKHLTQEDLDFIHNHDDANALGRIWFFVPTSLNVEVKYGRKLLSGFNFKASEAGGFVQQQYLGKAEKIYCVLHKYYLDSHAGPSLKEMFPEYSFSLKKESPEILIYEGIANH